MNNDEETVQETSNEKEDTISSSPVAPPVATSGATLGQTNSVDITNATNVQSSSAVLPTSVEAKNSPSTVTSLRPSSSSPSQSSDVFIEIKVGEPKKLGDGYGSYVVYKVSTRTNLPFFRRPSSAVNRRFSDFRGLRDKLAEKHLYLGRIVPPAPKKDAVGTAKVKMSKEDDLLHDEFIEKRRLGLERFLNRVAAHEVLRADPDFREFLELDTELPRAVDSSALSSAGVMRFFNRFGDKVNKLTFRMDESNPVSELCTLHALMCVYVSTSYVVVSSDVLEHDCYWYLLQYFCNSIYLSIVSRSMLYALKQISSNPAFYSEVIPLIWLFYYFFLSFFLPLFPSLLPLILIGSIFCFCFAELNTNPLTKLILLGFFLLLFLFIPFPLSN